MSAEPCGDTDCERRRDVPGLASFIAEHGWFGSIGPGVSIPRPNWMTDEDFESIPVREGNKTVWYFGHQCGGPNCMCAAAEPTTTEEDRDEPGRQT